MRIEESHHPNGQIRWKASFENDKLVGIVRHWHDNGVLSRECPYESGLQNGVAQQWDREGKLLGEYHMKHGTGIERSWYENGRLERESSSINGKLCGRFRCWLEDGRLISEEYYIGNKKVSKTKYAEASRGNHRLPRYDKDGNLIVPLLSKEYEQSKLSEEKCEQHNEYIARFRDKSNQAEVRRWLADGENRFLGEMTPEASREVIEEGYKAGAVKITAVEIQDDTTDCLIVELPKDGVKRRKVFGWTNELAQSSGFDPDVDWGQGEVFVFLD